MTGSLAVAPGGRRPFARLVPRAARPPRALAGWHAPRIALVRMDLFDSLAALQLSRAPGVGAATFRRLVQQHGSPSAALAAFRPPAGTRPKAATVEGLARAHAWVARGGALRHVGGAGYPEKLLDLGEPPPVLFVDGDVDVLHSTMVALVGGREADDRVLARARAAGRACAERGLVVVSGGARGVDGAALAGALEAGGAAVAVLGCGVDVVYPAEHAALFARCRERGALVSELLPGTPPQGSFFVTRNRLVAALGAGCLLVWGEAGSGALGTLRWARRLGRPCAVGEGGAREEAQRQGACVVEDDARWLASLAR